MIKYPNPFGHKEINSEAWRKCNACKQRIDIGEEYLYIVNPFSSNSYHIKCYLEKDFTLVSFCDYWKLAVELWYAQKEIEELKEKFGGKVEKKEPVKKEVKTPTGETYIEFKKEDVYYCRGWNDCLKEIRKKEE